MIQILKKMFEGSPEKSTNVLSGKCSDCGCETIINDKAKPFVRQRRKATLIVRNNQTNGHPAYLRFVLISKLSEVKKVFINVEAFIERMELFSWNEKTILQKEGAK